ncbi:MAG: polysaccharide deacetylase family protein [Sedimentisphaerales bacterium]|nr:polysaccharide deacetylase family protein [Sedimentisphaerales bacterium]
MKAIMYHYVHPDDSKFPYFRHLHRDDFRAQLDYFSANFDLISNVEFLEAIHSGKPYRDAIILTFDDAFKDHYMYVLPELKQRGLWGIFYIPTGVYATGRLMDVHRIHLLLGKWGGQCISNFLQEMVSDEMLIDNHVEAFRSRTYRAQSNDDYTLHVKRTLNYYIGYAYRGDILNALMERFFPEEKALAGQFYMSEIELRKMQEAGMLIGSHSVNHPVMSKLTCREQKQEIDGSFAFLEQAMGRLSIRTFCYPYGGFHSFTGDTETLLDQAGCLFSFNVEHRDITAEDLINRPQALPRYDCNLFPHGHCRMENNVLIKPQKK